MQIVPDANKKKSDFINIEHLFGIKVRTNTSISGNTLQIKLILGVNFTIEK